MSESRAPSLITHHSSLITHPFFFAGPFRGGGPVSPFPADLREQLVDARRRLLDGVADEMKFGSVLEVEQDTQLPADVRGGAAQRLEGLGALGLRAGGGH